MDSDGAPTHFDNADQYLWISCQQNTTGIRRCQTFNCSCHGKAKVDPELGGAKHVVAAEMMKETDLDQSRRVESAVNVHALLQREYVQPSRSILAKKGVGITKRFIFFVPVSGPGSVNRRIRKGNTVQGSKQYHQFVDVGEPGVLEMRLRSCHQCPGCNNLTALANCANAEVCGVTERVEIREQISAGARQTRSALQDQGERLSAGVTLGQVIAVELTFESEVFMLGVVTKTKYTIDSQYESEYMGTLMPGDHVVEVRKFEPVQSGSSRFTLTSKVFPVFIEDIRDVLSEPEFVHEGGPRRSERQTASSSSSSSAPADTHRFVFGHSYRLVPSVLNRILQRVPDDADTSSPNSRRKQ